MKPSRLFRLSLFAAAAAALALPATAAESGIGNLSQPEGKAHKFAFGGENRE